MFLFNFGHIYIFCTSYYRHFAVKSPTVRTYTVKINAVFLPVNKHVNFTVLYR